MIVAVDAFGGDFAPAREVAGSIKALQRGYCGKIVLVGRQEEIAQELRKYDYDQEKVEVVDARQVITMEDKGARVVRKKKDSSLVRALELYKHRRVDAVFSAGNTGAVMSASLLVYGRLKGILRPAIATLFPGNKTDKIVLDVGANADCKPEILVQFAQMGSLYSHFCFDIDRPRVGLLNIGEESSKGSQLYVKVHENLQKEQSVNFIGNVEPSDVYGDVDVVVCDGFTGNIFLKSAEGTAKFVISLLKKGVKESFLAKIGALLMKPVFAILKKKMSPEVYGGALLMGLKGLTVIAHGSSSQEAIAKGIEFAAKSAQSGIVRYSKDFFEYKGNENGKISSKIRRYWALCTG